MSVKLDLSDGAGNTYHVFVGSGPERIEIRQGSYYASKGSLLPQLKQKTVLVECPNEGKWELEDVLSNVFSGV
jgi:hypothetical protein